MIVNVQFIDSWTQGPEVTFDENASMVGSSTDYSANKAILKDESDQ